MTPLLPARRRSLAALLGGVLLSAACQASPTSPASPPGQTVGAPANGTSAPSTNELDRYVSPDGTDAGEGSVDDPWATLQHAADMAVAGMTIHVADGTYSGFTISRSGTEAAPITIEAEPGATAAIAEAGRDFLLHVDGADDITIAGLHIRDATQQDGAGIYIGPGSARITVRRNVLVDNRSFGILVEDSRDVLIHANDISGSASGVRTRGDVAGAEILANDIHDNDQMVVNDAEPHNDTGGQGVAISISSGPVTVRGNHIWGNRAESMDYGQDGSAIEIFGATDVLITENVMWDNETVMETGANQQRECVNIQFTHNVAFAETTWGVSKGILLRCARDSLVAHNTLVGMEEWALQFRNRPEARFGSSIENLSVVNNLVSGDVAILVLDPLPASVVVDYNLVDADRGALARINGTTVTGLSDLRGYGLQGSGLHARIDLVDPAARDFRILPTSPAVDAGAVIEGVNDDFAGAAPDIGRYELR